MSILPNSDMIWSKVLRMSADFDTSQLIAATLRPGAPAWILALASASVPWSRARIATSAPDLAYSSAIARPSPLLPPVTTALRPFSLMSIPGLLPKLRPSSTCRLIDLLYVLFCQCPAARDPAAALFDWFRLGRPGDDAGRPRALRQAAANEGCESRRSAARTAPALSLSPPC